MQLNNINKIIGKNENCGVYHNDLNSTMKVNHSKKAGFTIIETLVAIAILMIAISGPLVVATKSLTAATRAKNQSVASFLAQEGMELIRNHCICLSSGISGNILICVSFSNYQTSNSR